MLNICFEKFRTAPRTYSDVFMPLITMAYLGATNQEYTLDNNLQNQLNAIISIFFKNDNTLCLQLISAIQQYIHHVRTKLDQQYSNDRIYNLNGNILSDFGHIHGNDQETILEESLYTYDESYNVYNILEKLITKHYNSYVYA